MKFEVFIWPTHIFEMNNVSTLHCQRRQSGDTFHLMSAGTTHGGISNPHHVGFLQSEAAICTLDGRGCVVSGRLSYSCLLQSVEV